MDNYKLYLAYRRGLISMQEYQILSRRKEEGHEPAAGGGANAPAAASGGATLSDKPARRPGDTTLMLGEVGEWVIS